MAYVQAYGTCSDLLLCLNGFDLVALLNYIVDKLLESGAVESLGFLHEVSCLGIGVQEEILEPCVDLVSELGIIGIGLVWFCACLCTCGDLCLGAAPRHLIGNEKV